MTYQEMCTDIASAVNERGLRLTGLPAPPLTAEQIYNYDPHGELFMLHVWYWSLFPERLPSDVENPNEGDMRYSEGKIQVWSKTRGWK